MIRKISNAFQYLSWAYISYMLVQLMAETLAACVNHFRRTPNEA